MRYLQHSDYIYKVICIRYRYRVEALLVIVMIFLIIQGLERIIQMVLRQLDRLQSAAQLDRIVACVTDPPAIDYNYTVYYLAMMLRLIFIIMKMKYPYFASSICDEFFPVRCNLRAKYLRASTLIKDKTQESHLSSHV